MSVVGGLDLNGAWDWAALSGGSGSDGTPLEPRLNSGGINGSVIKLYDDDQLVGGPQAELAPHGRGPGWGKIGGREFRTQVRHVLDRVIRSGAAHDDGSITELHAVIEALAGDADSLICAVPDHPGFDEASRQALLDALRARQRGSVSLLWRPIATLLGWLAGAAEDGHRDGLQEDMPVCVVSLMPDGARVAEARLKAYTGRTRTIWVPERRQPGVLLDGPYGGAELARQHAETLARQVEQDPAQVFDVMTAPWRAAMDQPGGETVVRLANRSWRRLRPVAGAAEFDRLPTPDAEASQRIQAAERIVVDGPFSANAAWRTHVLSALGISTSDQRVQLAGPATAALGCREAGERMAAGEPPYYDYLPQLEINALKNNEEQFVDLIGKHQRAIGGRPFVGQPDAKFAINAGATELTFYLIKEDFDRPRKAVHTLPESPTEDHPINVTVRQTPGQGYARVEISSSSYTPLRDAPLVLDWDQMEVLETDRETLLQELRDYSGIGYPDTYSLPGHALHWDPEHPSGSLADLLSQYADTPDITQSSTPTEICNLLSKLAERIVARQSPYFAARARGKTHPDKTLYQPIGTNGAIPVGDSFFHVPDESDNALSAALNRAAGHWQQVLHKPHTERNCDTVRDILRLCTWSHVRCPQTVRETLLTWVEHDDPWGLNERLLVEGTGRSLQSRQEFARFFAHCSNMLQDGEKLKNRHFAALAQILGRRPDSALELDRQQARLLVQEANRLISAENKKPRDSAYKQLFKYGLLMLAVILRYRRKESNFLALPDSTAGSHIRTNLENSISRIDQFVGEYGRKANRTTNQQTAQSHWNAIRRLERHKESAGNLLSFLKMEGGDPNIIRVIEESE